MYRVGKKLHNKLMATIRSNRNRFQNLLLEDSLINLQQSNYYGSHHTLHTLPHYFVKH